MKLKDIGKLNYNKRNNQPSITLGTKKIKKRGSNPDEIMNWDLVKPKKQK